MLNGKVQMAAQASKVSSGVGRGLCRIRRSMYVSVDNGWSPWGVAKFFREERMLLRT